MLNDNKPIDQSGQSDNDDEDNNGSGDNIVPNILIL